MGYLVNSAERIEISILIDTSRNDRVLRSSCPLIQGRSPCRGNPNRPCFQKYESCNEELKDVICMDDTSKLGDKLPENIIKETSQWARESWSISQQIEKESLTIDLKTGDRSVDIYKHMQNKIKFLLKSWTLEKSDPELKIILIKTGKFECVRQDILDKILEIEPNIINGFYAEYIKKIAGGEVAKKKDLKKCLAFSDAMTKASEGN